MTNKNHEIALWAGAAAFFSSLLAIGVFDILNPAEWLQWIGALIVAAITAAAVYSKQRLDDAKRETQSHDDQLEAPPQQRP